MLKRTTFVLVACTLFSGAAHAQIEYQASTGQSPLTQCWQYQGSSAPSPAGGEIDFGSSSTSETRFFVRNDIGGLDFSQTVVAECEVFVVSGNYSANPCGAGQRAGVSFGIGDAQGRIVHVGLGADQVYISTQSNAFAGANNPVTAFSTAGVWRVHRLVVSGFTATLFIDGQQVLQVSRPSWPTGQGTANTAFWAGDSTVCMPGHGRFRRFSVTGFPNGGGPSQVTLTTPPANARTCPGGVVRFDAAATSPIPIVFRWQRQTGVNTWADVSDGPTATATVYSGAATANLRLNSADEADNGAVYRLKCTTSCGVSYSAPVTATIECRSIADVTGLGATPGCDGQLTADDIIVFLDAFFSGNTAIADVARLGGTIGQDGQLTADDIIAFLAAFFAGCQ